MKGIFLQFPPSSLNFLNIMNFQNKYFKWLVVFITMLAIYSCIFYIYHDKYIPISDAMKYDLSAEVYKRLLFTGGIEEIHQYSREFYGREYSTYAFVTGVEKPLYFLYLSIIKMVSSQPVGVLFLANIILLGVSILLLSETLQPSKKMRFVFLCGFLLSPFIVYQAINAQAHVLEVFLTCLGIYFYNKKSYFWGFFIMTSSVFAHPSNLPVLLSLWIYHVFIFKKDWHGYVSALLGSLAWCISFTFIEYLMFMRDQSNLFPHTYELENILLFKGATSGEYSVTPGFINFWRNSFILAPIATVGLFWIRNKFQFAVTLLPVIIALIATKLNMVTHRSFLPVYFIAYTYFICYFLSTNSSKIKKRTCVFVMVLAMVSSVSYYSHVAQSLSIKDKTVVAIERPPADVDYSNGGSYGNLLWNMKRFNQVDDNGEIVYSVFKHPISQPSNIPNPHSFYPYSLAKIVSKFIRPELIGIDTTTPRELSLRKVTKVN